MCEFVLVNPASWSKPRGYSNGVLAPANARVLFVAGQIGWNERCEFESDDFVRQFDQALANVIAVIEAAGGKFDSIARLTIYVTDKHEYVARQREIGESYRARMEKHFPAMTLVEVKSLLEDRAKIEIEATAVL